jgi:anti-sigma B factor antagonist
LTLPRTVRNVATALESAVARGRGPGSQERFMPEQAPPVAVTQDKHVQVIEFVHSKILDEANIAGIGDTIGSLIEESERPALLLDFSHVDHLSSAALGMLITVSQKVRAKNGELRMCGIKPQIFEVFKITKLDKLFRIYPTRAEALGSFNGYAQTA